MPEIVGDVGDPEHGTLGREAAKDRKSSLERLGVTWLAKAGYRPLALLA